jgi:hypothetical protein
LSLVGHNYDDDNDNGPATPLGTPPGTSNPQEDTGAITSIVTLPASDSKEHMRQCPPMPRKPTEEEETIVSHTKVMSRAVTVTAKVRKLN